jgi:hypothetical protein
MILWTLLVQGPQPYIVARDLTNTQCQQMKKDMAAPVTASPREKQRSMRIVCKPQYR